MLAALDSFPLAKARPALETMEHLALLKRWFYRGRRVGEIFLADDKGVFPMRRIVRGIGRVFRGEGPDEDGANQIRRSDDPYRGMASGVPPVPGS